jgi:hypothetical protein
MSKFASDLSKFDENIEHARLGAISRAETLIDVLKELKSAFTPHGLLRGIKNLLNIGRKSPPEFAWWIGTLYNDVNHWNKMMHLESYKKVQRKCELDPSDPDGERCIRIITYDNANGFKDQNIREILLALKFYSGNSEIISNTDPDITINSKDADIIEDLSSDKNPEDILFSRIDNAIENLKELINRLETNKTIRI